MSKWASFIEKKSQLAADEQADADEDGGRDSDGQCIQATFVDPFQAVNEVRTKIIRNLGVCDRLPKSPTFMIDNKEVDVREGVIGAMGSSAAELLNLAQPTIAEAPSIGLGIGSSSHDEEVDEQ